MHRVLKLDSTGATVFLDATRFNAKQDAVVHVLEEERGYDETRHALVILLILNCR